MYKATACFKLGILRASLVGICYGSYLKYQDPVQNSFCHWRGKAVSSLSGLINLTATAAGVCPLTARSSAIGSKPFSKDYKGSY